MAYNITPLSALGGVVSKQSISEVVSTARSPHTKWVERLRTAIDFITPDNTLVCVADAPFHEDVQNVTPIGITQAFGYSEGLGVALVPEIGTRRKRAMVGSSQGGGISIAKMVCMGESPLYTLVGHNPTMGINKEFWTEKEWLALVGMNHDAFRRPIGLIIVDAAPDGRNYSAKMFEQSLVQGESSAYQAGQHLVVSNINMVYEQIVPIWSITRDEVVNYGTTI